MRRTIIQLSEEQLEYLIDSLPAPSNEEGPLVKSLRERLNESLRELKEGRGGRSIEDFDKN